MAKLLHQRKHFIDNPKAAWEVVFQIIEGFNVHHKEYKPKNFTNNNGKMSSHDKDDAKILKTYFQDVFNRKATIDPSILDELTQRPVTMSFDMVPSIDEIKTAEKKRKKKAPGIFGTTTDMIKIYLKRASKFSHHTSNNSGRILTMITRHGTRQS